MAKATEDKAAESIPVEVQVKDTGACAKTVSVTVAAEQVNREFNAAVGELAGRINLPGFRPGKTPRNIIEKRFGGDIQKQVTATLLNKAYRSTLEKEHLQVLGEPELDFAKYKAVKNEPFTFTMDVEVRPVIELSNYQGLPIEQEEIELLPGEEEAALEHVIEQFAEEVAAPADHAIGQRDTINGCLRVLVEGKEVHREADHGLVVLDNHVLGAYAHLDAKFLLGAKIGEKRSVEAELNQQFPVSEYRGKKATLEFEVQAVKLRKLPPLDDETAKKLGLASVEDLKQKVHASLLEDLAEKVNERTRYALLDRVAGATQFELPKRLSEKTATAATEERLEYLSKMGLTPEMLGGSKETLEAATKEKAILDARRIFILEAICEKEGITVSDEAIDEEIVKLARQRGMRASEFYDQLVKQDQLKALAAEIKTRKGLDYLAEHADIKVVPRQAPEKHSGHEHGGETAQPEPAQPVEGAKPPETGPA